MSTRLVLMMRRTISSFVVAYDTGTSTAKSTDKCFMVLGGVVYTVFVCLFHR